jgi:ABC-2 type transport system ATP-binding protein
MAIAPDLLSIHQLSYWFGKRQAVKDVSLEVRKGEVLGLLGPNGAGKTTTISCIAGLLKDWTGKMQFNGQAFAPAIEAKDRLQLGFVPQELAIYPNLTAEENLVFFAKLSGVPAAQRNQVIEKNLELAGLTDRRKDLVSTFSGGMQRRLNLACGLVHAPALILLDEPTVGVDPQSRNHIFETLMRLRAEGHSLIYTTHYMEEAQRLCDRIAVMHDGVIAAVGTHQELAIASGNKDANLEAIFLQLTGRSLRDE